MKLKDGLAVGERIRPLLQRGKTDEAYHLLDPVISSKTPFPVLEKIGKVIGTPEAERVNPFLDQIAAEKTMGGWVIIGGALQMQLERDLVGAFEKARGYITEADTWYGADIFGERVPGPGLILSFEEAVEALEDWRVDENRWVRRAVGVACHYWAKRSKGDPVLINQAQVLLDFLAPMVSEWDMDAVKGVGWGIKTMGKFYGELLSQWLPKQLTKKHRRILYRKAVTYLSDEQRGRVESGLRSG